ncbi:pyridoxamine 5'-phosphate oxidase family protein [Fructobacillus sp. M1-13]|uniref:Pyridoxamine 5'-phosphate oxidase family protein n=1 Tax=Fructobacillus papyriferae TaxID=2713171 RepID=A0ABS5QRW4_9LACO|nr:pyridoxamine 5'-phosphate oxidase family protein [Fructobacillus papyriferae]MBS9335567.1 pyridoxamine 5'-phosphate oxidase family protein [Fructobacillus papyriferae]MCD2159343.1 pyridoxamine 5'-phosphate oxidase family protein [Fructobacillus papyriferae]
MTLFEEYAQAAKGLLYVATAKDDQPGLRIMGFAMDPKKINHWYLVSQPDAAKMTDLKENDRVAIMTVMNENGARIESNQATLRPAKQTWSDVKDYFTNPIFHKNHPHPEEETLLELRIESARLASYAGEEVITFED